MAVKKEEVFNEAEFKKQQEAQKTEFLAEPKVPIYVPADTMNGSKTLWLSINGVEFVCKRGETVQMPQSFATLYMQSQQQTQLAEAQIRDDMEV